ncbi:YkvA family protein [Algoriphagus terrigena]|uniref:YkvA family protein n=1 Tax=Algoriphagus terrigena TaxID=344884 RepID=UPI0004286827|nr:YkvA family protein [Algoriphagus terrigena]
METTSKTTEIIDRAKALFGKQVDAIVRQEQKVVELVQNVGKKLAKLADNPKVKLLTQPIQIFVRMIKAHFRGEHKISFGTLGLIILALVYFLSPIDLIPDFLGFFGFADDLSIVLAVFAKVKDEVDGFLEWEKSKL